MPIVLVPIDGAGPDRFSVYDGDRKIGRIQKAGPETWAWNIDWFAIGRKLLAQHRGTREEATADLKRMWEIVTQEGVEELGKGHASTPDEALEKFKGAWAHVTNADKLETGDGPF
jgi:hypothetical protein